ncbi:MULTISPECIES: phage holin family protein [unclassified Actinomyces]|uniref:phage holin family protein n=1 Tax=unclassified Actinomyces TaxID=2609248 RepID=UPI001373E241|nr:MULTISPECIES: phage holin family protein [unclassified Actinomyces]NDR53191.1 phage holin family protein [Actinomyces sp. 565]QHO90117.1 phage holin family protein [Actinomyces sp. 432]
MDLIVRTLGNAGGLWLAVALLPGMAVPGTPSLTLTVVNLLVVGLVLALVNSLIKPVARVLAFPLYVMTFGLFALVVNGAMLMLTSRITDVLAGVSTGAELTLGLHVATFGTAIVGSLIVSVASAIIVGVLGPSDHRNGH